MGRGSETCLCRRVGLRIEYISPDMSGMEIGFPFAVLNSVYFVCLDQA